jgi:hypothetical protein
MVADSDGRHGRARRGRLLAPHEMKPTTGWRWRATSRAPARRSCSRARCCWSEADLRSCAARLAGRVCGRGRRSASALARAGAPAAAPPFVLGPHINVYSRPRSWSTRRWAPSAGSRRSSWGSTRWPRESARATGCGAPAPAPIATEVFASAAAARVLGALLHGAPPEALEGRLRFPLHRGPDGLLLSTDGGPALPHAQRHPDAVGRAALPDRRGRRRCARGCRACGCRPVSHRDFAERDRAIRRRLNHGG